MHTHPAGAALALLAAVAGAQDAPELVAPDVLSPTTFDAWRDYIRATPDERAWADLPWLMSFHAGLGAAAQAHKPLLLWTMNGHPFGCT